MKKNIIEFKKELLKEFETRIDGVLESFNKNGIGDLTAEMLRLHFFFTKISSSLEPTFMTIAKKMMDEENKIKN